MADEPGQLQCQLSRKRGKAVQFGAIARGRLTRTIGTSLPVALVRVVLYVVVSAFGAILYHSFSCSRRTLR